MPTSGLSQRKDERVPAPSIETKPAWKIPWTYGLLFVWGAGIVACLLPMLAGLRSIRRLARQARATDDPQLDSLLVELAQTLGVRRPVRLLETSQPTVPMTWGVLRPTVLSPGNWREWSVERRRAVLLHELAHVRRDDLATQYFARLVCACYWFHPLAWYGLRQMQIERELACDDCVLRAGPRPADYASHLLEIARGCLSTSATAALAMARSGSLERRVRAILDQRRSHLPLSRRGARLLLGCVTILPAILAAVRPGITGESASPAQPSSSAAAPANTDRPKQDSGEIRLEYAGQVVDAKGQPVQGAKIFLVYWFHNAPPGYTAPTRAVTGADGRFAFTTTKADVVPLPEYEWWWHELVAVADGHGLARDDSFKFDTAGKTLELGSADGRRYREEKRRNFDRVLHLAPDDVPITGRVLAKDGRPVAGARFQLTEIDFPKNDDLTAWEQAARKPQADYHTLELDCLGNINGPQLTSIIPEAITDATGAFTLRGIGRERIMTLTLRGPGIETTTFHAHS